MRYGLRAARVTVATAATSGQAGQNPAAAPPFNEIDMHTLSDLSTAYHRNAAANPLADTIDLLEMTAEQHHCSAEDVARAVELEGVV